VQISVSSQRTGDVLTVRIAGDVDLATARTVENAILDAIAVDGVREVRVDLSQVEFLDSSGVALLLKGRRAADERPVRFRVTDVHGIPRQILELTGVWTHLLGDSGTPRPAP
jgi:anti-sigma B factor antagonist